MSSRNLQDHNLGVQSSLREMKYFGCVWQGSGSGCGSFGYSCVGGADYAEFVLGKHLAKQLLLTVMWIRG
jgi:hypothetical protein